MLQEAGCATQILCAWGNGGKLLKRDKAVLELLASAGLDEQLTCLHITKAGQPQHPLYVRADTQPVRYPASEMQQPTPSDSRPSEAD